MSDSIRTADTPQGPKGHLMLWLAPGASVFLVAFPRLAQYPWARALRPGEAQLAASPCSLPGLGLLRGLEFRWLQSRMPVLSKGDRACISLSYGGRRIIGNFTAPLDESGRLKRVCGAPRASGHLWRRVAGGHSEGGV